MKKFISSCIAFVLLLSVFGCSTVSAAESTESLEILTVGDEATFNQLIAEVAELDSSRYGHITNDALVGPNFDMMIEAPIAAAPSAGAGSTESAPSVVSTNTQVEGVDESDIIKTDSEYIYHLRGSSNGSYAGEVEITKVDGSNLTSAFHIQPTDNFMPEDMYLDGDTLILIGFDSEDRYGSTIVQSWKMPDGTASEPLLDKEFILNASTESSRLVNHRLFLIAETYLDTYQVTNYLDSLPKYSYEDTNGLEYIDLAGMYYFPDQLDSSLLIVADIGIQDGISEVKSVLGSLDGVYMSTSALYIAKYNRNPNIWIEEFPFKTENQISDASTFYKFKVKEGTAPGLELVAKGTASGKVINQYSMDEFDGYFRVATTYHNMGGTESGVTILDFAMRQVGSVDGLAPGERIYSARFMGEKAYIVTYKETDPLFAIDLSNPVNPKVVGELKIPGFSTYLHPFGEDKLIGFGRHSDTITAFDSEMNPINSWVETLGLKLSLFDVSDMSKPSELDKEVIGTQVNHSELEYNPKLFLFDAERNILAFPVTSYDSDDQDTVGVYLFKFTDNSIEPIGVIKPHRESLLYEGRPEAFDRSVIIGDIIYSVDDSGIQANDLVTLKLLGELSYPEFAYQPKIIVIE